MVFWINPRRNFWIYSFVNFNGIPRENFEQIFGGLFEEKPVCVLEGISEKLTEETTEKKIFFNCIF